MTFSQFSVVLQILYRRAQGFYASIVPLYLLTVVEYSYEYMHLFRRGNSFVTIFADAAVGFRYVVVVCAGIAANVGRIVLRAQELARVM